MWYVGDASRWTLPLPILLAGSKGDFAFGAHLLRDVGRQSMGWVDCRYHAALYAMMAVSLKTAPAVRTVYFRLWLRVSAANTALP